MKPVLITAAAFAIAMPAAAQTPLAPAKLDTVSPASANASVQASQPSSMSAPAPKMARIAAPLFPPHRTLPPSPAELRIRVANRSATFEPATGGYVNAAQVYPYSDGVIYHVYAAPGQVTDIALQPGETLGAVAAGDTVRWVIGDTTSGSGDAKRTHVLIKPFAAGLATNLVVTTDRRAYHLALTATARTAMAALSWTYPQDQLIAFKAAADQARSAAPVSSGLAVDQLRFDYVISGDRPTWRPLRAFDDGRQTFIEFPVNISVGEAPPLFLVDATGTASLVNYRVQGRYYVVDRLFDAAELRLGLKHQDIVRIARTGEPTSGRRGS